MFKPIIKKHERLISVHINLFIIIIIIFIYSFIYLFIFAYNVDLEKFLSLQKATFGRYAIVKFKLMIDKYKVKGQNSSNLFFND